MASNMRKVAVLMFTALIINQYAFLSEAQSTENTDLECNLVFDGKVQTSRFPSKPPSKPRVPEAKQVQT